eukprot:m.14338 g.14338  ORF g.14338 m.14338 type:complete len:381 (+) comp25701_c0_seq2:11-1153(+)
MMRLGVKRSRKSALLGLCALVIVLIVVNVFKRRHESDKEPLKPPESSHTDTADLLSVFDFHCNTVQTLKNKRLPQSAEGNFPETDQYEIQQVQVVTRHGDRAAIFSTPMTHFNRFQCPGSDYFDKTARLAQVRCRKAQLTKTGCEQHQTLGEHFRKAYDFSVDIDELKLKMTVRSTKYQRTITSALCFMNGLLGDRSFTKGQIIIHSSDVFRDNPFVDTGFETQCPRLNSIWAKSKTRPAYVSASKRWDHIRRRAINFVASSENQLQRPSLSLTAIGDNIYTHFCHLRNSMGDESITPCVRPGFCLPVTLAGDILRAFDECTTFNYTEEVGLLCKYLQYSTPSVIRTPCVWRRKSCQDKTNLLTATNFRSTVFINVSLIK